MIITAAITALLTSIIWISVPHIKALNSRLKEQKQHKLTTLVEQIIDQKLKDILND